MPDWIRVQKSVHADPQVIAMAAELGVPVEQTVGHLVALWAQMAEHARRGDVAKISSTVVEQWARWIASDGRFDQQFRQHFVVDGRVKNWDRYNGKPLRDAELDAKRKRLARRRKSHGRPADVHRTSGGAAGVRTYETDVRTDGRTTTEEEPSSTARAREALPEAYRPDFERLLRSATSPESVALETLTLVAGRAPIAEGATPDDVGRGIREMLLNGDRPSKLGRYVRVARDQRLRPAEPPPGPRGADDEWAAAGRSQEAKRRHA